MARQFNTDCEGVISKNDNAQEFCVDVLGEGELDGAGFFARISRYDDFLADAEHKKGYKAGDTLRLILPFLRACGATNAWLAQYSMDNILLVPGAKETLDYIRQRMESFIISTSYSPYIEMLCEAIGFPPENAYSTELDMDQYEIPEALARRLRALAQEILILPLIEIPDGAGSLDDLSPESQGAVRRLDDIFWTQMPMMSVPWRMLCEVNPVGGVEKANAIKDSLRRTGNNLADVMYVGDSITDGEAFRLVRKGGGATVSFNGNRYALREAQIAVVANNTILLSILADVFTTGGLEGVLEFVSCWTLILKDDDRSRFQTLGIDPALISELEQRHTILPSPGVQIITDDNRARLTTISERVRKKVRGEKIGALG